MTTYHTSSGMAVQLDRPSDQTLARQRDAQLDSVRHLRQRLADHDDAPGRCGALFHVHAVA
ncbi:MAG: hypothetical protein KGY99_01420 [Phycisphaerae bacterium]|nr:hypothetical protein [Phycisphaerae bacterium]